MFFLSHCCQSPFPCWESLSTASPYSALQHCTDLWTCCWGSSDSNLVLLLCVLASNVHHYQNYCVFFCGGSQFHFIYFIDRVCLVDVWILSATVGRFQVFFLSYLALTGATQVLQGSLRSKIQWTTHTKRWK